MLIRRACVWDRDRCHYKFLANSTLVLLPILRTSFRESYTMHVKENHDNKKLTSNGIRTGIMLNSLQSLKIRFDNHFSRTSDSIGRFFLGCPISPHVFTFTTSFFKNISYLHSYPFLFSSEKQSTQPHCFKSRVCWSLVLSTLIQCQRQFQCSNDILFFVLQTNWILDISDISPLSNEKAQNVETFDWLKSFSSYGCGRDIWTVFSVIDQSSSKRCGFFEVHYHLLMKNYLSVRLSVSH